MNPSIFEKVLKVIQVALAIAEYAIKMFIPSDEKVEQ